MRKHENMGCSQAICHVLLWSVTRFPKVRMHELPVTMHLQMFMSGRASELSEHVPEYQRRALRRNPTRTELVERERWLVNARQKKKT